MNRLCVREVGGRLHCRWWCADSEEWAMVLASFRSTFRTHGQATYSPRTGWSLPLGEGVRLADWAERHFAPQEVEWEHEEPQAGSARTEGPPATLEAAYRVLHLYPSAPDELVVAAHRVMLRQVHPDRGGSHQAAVAVNAAWEVITRHQKQKQKKERRSA